MEFKNTKDQTDGNVLHYIKNSKGTQLYFTKTNKDSLLHKIDDTDKLITVCAENQNAADQVALIEYTFKTSVHVNDFSNVATTVTNFFYQFFLTNGNRKTFILLKMPPRLWKT